jgi:uncharacterized membrane protein YkvA (DUF1232 family)
MDEERHDGGALMAELTEFQSAAVNRIVGRLTSTRGSRRFLLADEVGLGKTIVAQQVLARLAQRRRGRRGFSVIYLCSNSEIAAQNSDRLCITEDTIAAPKRLTLLATESAAIQRAREVGKVKIYSLTPGTSLNVGNSTGTATERCLLLFLLKTACRRPAEQQTWRRLFQCGANPHDGDRWLRRTKAGRLRHEFRGQVAGDLRRRFAETVRGYHIDYQLDDDENEKMPLLDALGHLGPQQPAPRSYAWRVNRNRVIGGLRACLARVALEHLEPDLIVLDEFQRFREILRDVGNAETLVGRLLETKRSAVLVLSATPYKMYTQDFDSENHHQDFLRTLAFLVGEPIPAEDALPDSPRVCRVRDLLRQFELALRKHAWEARPKELERLRARLETTLAEVMCRTERNWYLDASDQGVLESPADLSRGDCPNVAELEDYLRARRFLLNEGIEDWNVLDFWKSCPSILTFMDQSYALTRRVRKRSHTGTIPEALLLSFPRLPQAWQRNLKFRKLFAEVFDAQRGPRRPDKPSVAAWKYLWVPPSYAYYRTPFYGAWKPRKALVFSHWRFVPKAIAVLTSQAVDRALRSNQRAHVEALRFRKALSFAAFDVCFPSPALADVFSHTAAIRRMGRVPTEAALTRECERAVRKLLQRSGIPIKKAGGSRLWDVVARIEARQNHGAELARALEAVESSDAAEGRANMRRHLDEFSELLADEESEVAISERNLRSLVRIACYSPAVCLLRSVRSTLSQRRDDDLEHVMRLCLNDVRGFFNRRLSQAIVRRWGGNDRFYANRVLRYCRDAQFQPVADEYCYVLANVCQHWSAEELTEHLARGMGMGTGLPTVNYRGRTGRFGRTTKTVHTHFALAFGDEASPEGATSDAAGRRTDVREAFNSPFWPFVLATTSVGQEGLDFHLYCRDIIHWNLPSNPVDLEQREGRINRRDGHSVRINIASDFPLPELLGGDEHVANPWAAVFSKMYEKHWGPHVFKHGLAPHWLYEAERTNKASSAVRRELVRRHLFFYGGSKDVERYDRLKKSLSLYRLVFGQPRQQDLLNDVFKDRGASEVEALGPTLRRFMINLSPMPAHHARNLSFKAARQVVADPQHVADLSKEVMAFLTTPDVASALKAVRPKIIQLLQILDQDGKGRPWSTAARVDAAAALLYLINPYDETFDFLGGVGYEDDIKFLREMHAKIYARHLHGRGATLQ